MRNVRPRFSVESRRMVAEFLDSIRPIAKEHSVTLAQLVIAWTLAQPGLTHALVGARSIEQAQENAAAADLQLTDEEVQQITTSVGDLGERIGSSAPTSSKS